MKKKLFHIKRYYYRLSPLFCNRDDEDDVVGLDEYFVSSSTLEEAFNWVKQQHPKDFNVGPSVKIEKEPAYTANNYPFQYHKDKWFGIKGSNKYCTEWFLKSETATKTVYERITYGDWKNAGFRYVIDLKEPFVEI